MLVEFLILAALAAYYPAQAPLPPQGPPVEVVPPVPVVPVPVPVPVVKTCYCTAACVCGCNAGGVCACPVVPGPAYSRPAFIPRR